MLLAVPALAGVWTGSEFDDVVRGSHAGDQINGLGGDDDLLGLAGNDLYVFGEEWGHDRIEKRATFKVGKKRKPGGTDFLDFSDVTSGPVDAFLVPQWGPAFNGVGGAGGGHDVALGASPVEGVIGSRAGTADQLNGGGAANLLHTGGGGGDFLFDVGGWPKGAGGRPGVPALKDVYTGVAGNDGLVQIADWGGEPDILDLRPLASADLRVQALDADGDPNRTLDSLQIDWDGGGLVWILGHYGDYRGQSAQFGQRGRLELLALSDGYFQTPVTPQSSTESSAKRQGPASADAVLERIPSRLAEAAAERLRDAALSAVDVPEKAPAGDRNRAQVPAGGADAVALLRSADLDLPADRPDRDQGGDGHTKDGEQSAELARSEPTTAVEPAAPVALTIATRTLPAVFGTTVGRTRLGRIERDPPRRRRTAPALPSNGIAARRSGARRRRQGS
jgi:hypothetical protein